jgi:hypothetical protein
MQHCLLSTAIIGQTAHQIYPTNRHIDWSSCRFAAEERVQESLTDDMVAMAQQLRSSAEAMSAALHERDCVLQSTSQGLEQSAATVKQRVAATKQSVQRSRRSMFFILFALLGVAGVFMSAP